MTSELGKIRDKKDLQELITRNYIALAELVVKKSGPVTTYGQFAKLTGISGSDMTHIIAGRRKVPMEAALRACDVFHVNYYWMFAGQGELHGENEALRIALESKERMDKLEKLMGVKKKK